MDSRKTPDSKFDVKPIKKEKLSVGHEPKATNPGEKPPLGFPELMEAVVHGFITRDEVRFSREVVRDAIDKLASAPRK